MNPPEGPTGGTADDDAASDPVKSTADPSVPEPGQNLEAADEMRQVLGLLNTLLRPVLVLLTLPVTLLTLGLFLFVINALMFYFAGALLAGFHVAGFGAALIGSLLYSLCGMVIDVAIERLFAD